MRFLMVLLGLFPAQAVAAAPVTVDDTYNVVAGTTFTVAAPGVISNDTDLAPGAAVQWQTNPPAGFTLNTDGSINYVVPAAASGTASFKYCVLDLPGSPSAQCISNLATVTVHIASPVTVDDTYNVVAGTTFADAAPGVLANDTNIAPGAGVHWQTSPPAGFTLNTNGSINYVVPVSASGTATFTYCVLDLPGSPSAQCVSNQATVTVHIAAPVAVDDTYNVLPGTTFTIAAPGVLANDTNLAPGAVVGWQTSPPSGFTLNSDGSVSYPVPSDATGTSSFQYCVLDMIGSRDARCISNLATVTVNVVTEAPPSTTPGGQSGLPRTGTRISMFTLAGAGLILVGAVVLVLSRRRRA